MRWRDFEVLTCGPWCQGPVLAQALAWPSSVPDSTAPSFDDPALRPPLDRGPEGRLRRSRVPLRRPGDSWTSGSTSCCPTRTPMRGSQRSTRRARRRACRRRSGGRPTSPLHLPPTLGTFDARPARHVVRVRRRRRRQRVLGRAVGRLVLLPGRPRPGHRARPSAASSRGPTRGTPRASAPGRRPRLTPNPAMAVRDDGSLLVFGCPGGDMQVQAMLQVVPERVRSSAWTCSRRSTRRASRRGASRTRSRRTSTCRAGSAWRTASATRCRTPWSACGHDVVRWPSFTRAAAAVEAIYADARTGFLRAGADPRQPAYAIVA